MKRQPGDRHSITNDHHLGIVLIWTPEAMRHLLHGTELNTTNGHTHTHTRTTTNLVGFCSLCPAGADRQPNLAVAVVNFHAGALMLESVIRSLSV